MADYTLTSSAVVPSDTATLKNYTAGATILAGQPLYSDATALDARNLGKVKPADANGSLATSTLVGIAASSASSGQPVRVITADSDYTHGLTTVVAGQIIVVSATAGGLAPASDMASGMFPAVAMITTSATKAVVSIVNGGVVKP
jgi:hypothetical protein